MNGPSHRAGQRLLTNSPIATLCVLVVSVTAALHLAAELLIPLAFAIMLNLLLSPIVRGLQRVHIPAALSAAALVAAIVGTVVLGATGLADPAEQWLSEAPKSIRQLKNQVLAAEKGLSDIQQLANEVDQLGSTDDAKRAQTVVVQGPGILENLLGGLPTVATFTCIVVFLTYFLLASGDSLLRRITRCGRTWTERRRIVSIVRQIQFDLARYLTTVTVINVLLGLIVALTMQLLGVRNPLLWGAMATLFNFAPYVGPVVTTGVLTLVGLTSFESVADALTVPASFALLTIVEGQLVTPAVLGQRMSISPTFVFLSVIFWGWLWGVAGALIAVPIVTSLKVVCDHVPALMPISMVLGREDWPPQAGAGVTRPAAMAPAAVVQSDMALSVRDTCTAGAGVVACRLPET